MQFRTLLTRLRDGGLVATEWRAPVESRPRKYYAITADGRRALERFRSDWARFRDGVDRALATGGGVSP